MFRSLSTCVLLLLFALPGVALAQGTGTLAGRVLDGATNEGLPGANVLIQGTTLGAATDIDGNYRIIGVPVGVYTVEASYAGYQSQAFDDVSISNGYTQELEFSLASGELGEITVEYERPIIQKDAIGAPRVVGAEDIENLPVRGVGAVTALQGSVVEGSSGGLNIRGGRSEEVQFFVDGVKVRGLTGVNQQAIQEQEMLIGSIPARYGDAQAGVVSITTKTGRQDFFGSLEGVTSRGLDSYGYNLGSFSLGGPVVPGRAGFFLSGEALYRDDVNPFGIETYNLPDATFNSLQVNPQVLTIGDADGNERFLPFDPSLITGEGIDGDSLQTLLLASGALAEGETILNGGALTNRAETFTANDFDLQKGKDNPFESFTFNGNLNFDLTSAINLRVGAGYETRTNEERSFTSSLYNRDAFNIDERDSYRLYGTFRQRVTDQAFYQIQGEFQDFQYVQRPNGRADDMSDLLEYGNIDNPASAIAQNYYVLIGDSYQQQFTRDSGSRPGRVQPEAFSLPGRANFNNFQMSHNQQYRFSGNATTQIGVHQLEFGGEYEQEARRFYSVNAYTLAGFVNDEDGLENSAPTGFPDGITNFTDLTFRELQTRVSYYGYNYHGTEEVNSQDIDRFFDNEDVSLESKHIDAYRPIYYAGYISDKIEYQDIVITAGLRVDVFDNNTQVLRDLFAPVPIQRAGSLASVPAGIEPDYAVYFASDETTVVGYRDLDGNFFDAEGASTTVNAIIVDEQAQVVQTDEARSAAFEPYTAQVTVMPRVGVSFPVTDRALFFASYDVVSQRPTENGFAPISVFRNLSGLSFRTANNNLEPERTTQYQLGFRQRLGERAAISIAGFYRTQENKITNRPLDGSFPRYGTYVNDDFTTTQGAELTFDLRRTNNLALTANYTLQYAQGTSSDANAVSVLIWRAGPGDPFPNFVNPASFDQRHTANVTLDYRLGKGEGPMLGGIHAFENFGINLIGQFGSGQRYTRLEPNTGFQVGDSFTTPALGSINSATLPANTQLDMRIDRAFDLGFSDARLRAYVQVTNLLDTQNVLAVYRSTGQPDNDGYLQTPGGQTQINTPGRLFNYQAYAYGPVNVSGNQSSAGGLFYGSPRQIRLGLLFDF
ncbi:MAG: carboxypeptidase-like regulatory domain-containing protein [Bacteroidota bacterium]